MDELSKPTDWQVLQTIISALQDLSDDDRQRMLQTAATFFKLDAVKGSSRPSVSGRAPSADRPDLSYSSEDTASPKEFLIEKAPKSDVERIACLAYYLTHYRGMPHFKTLELSKLNTDAALPKLSNAAYAAANAVKMGYLAVGHGGKRQLSAAGEQFVRALPDRAAAKQAMERWTPRRRKRGGKVNRGSQVESELPSDGTNGEED